MLDRFSTFTVLVDKLKRSIRRIKTGEMAEFELKSPHVSCLYYLYRYDTLTSTELVEICKEDKASVSRSIEFLEVNGYVTCNQELHKRYKSPFILTEKGKAVAKKVVDKVDRILDEASRGLSEDERNTMYRCMAVISANLDNMCGEYEE